MTVVYDAEGDESPAQQVGIWTVDAPTVTISGQLTVGGSPLPGATVTLSGSQSGTTTTDANGYWRCVVAAGSYTITPSAPGYSFSPPSVTFSNLLASQAASFQVTPPAPTCTGITPKYIATIQANGVPELWIVSAQGTSPGNTVSALVWNESQPETSATVFAGQPGASSVALSSASFTQLGSYTVQLQVTDGGRTMACPGSAFFAVLDKSKQPPNPPNVPCNSMAGTWTADATSVLNLTQANDGTISGNATRTLSCGTVVWPVSSSGVSNASATLSLGTPTPPTTSCATLTSSEVHVMTFANSACSAVNDSYTATYPDGDTEPGTATFTSTPAVPTGETSSFVKWDTAAGYSTEALFQMTLSTLPNGETFAGRTVVESASSVVDGCNQITGSEDVPPFVSGNVASS
jgi:hypothetical protein